MPTRSRTRSSSPSRATAAEGAPIPARYRYCGHDDLRSIHGMAALGTDDATRSRRRAEDLKSRRARRGGIRRADPEAG